MASKAQTPTDAMEKAFEAGKERLEQAMKTGSDAATKNIEKVMAFSQKQMDDSSKLMEEMTTFAKGIVEALLASGKAAQQGMEELSKAAADYSKKSAEDMTAMVKTLSTAKSPKDFFEVQNATLKSNYDSFVAEASKMTELGMKVMSSVFEPVSNRMAVTMDKFAKAAK